jgi:hypothetical protein
MTQINPTASAFPFERIEAMNIQNLGTGKYAGFSSLRDRLGNAYQELASGNDYKKNTRDLRIIQAAVVTVSAIATGFTNGFAHRDKIGDEASFGLAILIVAFVERFYFVLRHGLTTTYQAGKQRFYALLCYRAIQITMIFNAAILTAWIVGLAVPAWLELWNHWSIAFHFGLALIGVQAVRDSDSVVENKMLELKAATAAQDIITAQRTAAVGNPIVLIFARIRGFFDAVGLALRLLFRRGSFAREYLSQIDAIAPPASTSSTQRRPGFVNQNPPPKAPARWI